MTALNAFATPDAGYIVTDGVVTDGMTGNVNGFCSKVFPLARFNAAAAVRGPVAALPMLWAFLDASPALEAPDLAGYLSARLSEMRANFAELDWSQLGAAGENAGVDILVAGFHDGRARLFFLTTFAGMHADFPEALSWYEVDRVLVSPNTHGLAALMTDFNPSLDAVPLIVEQRAHSRPWGPPESQGATGLSPFVGGFVQVTRVDVAGVSTSVVHRFDDVVGRRIEPDHAVRPASNYTALPWR